MSGLFEYMISGSGTWLSLVALGIVVYVILARRHRLLTNLTPAERAAHRQTEINAAKIFGLIVIIVFVCGVGIPSLIDEINALRERQEQAIVDQWGERTFQLCTTSTTRISGRGQLAADARLIFIRQDSTEVISQYSDLLPTERRATSKGDLVGVACVRETSVLIETANYVQAGQENNQGAPVLRTCKRYSRQLVVGLFEVDSGKQVGSRVFRGTTPQECPEKTSDNLTYYGELPTGETIVEWSLGIS